MKSIYIIGAGGFAKEVLYLINTINKIDKKFEFRGFVDKKKSPSALRINNTDYEIIDQDIFLNDYKNNRENINIALGIGVPQIIKNVVKEFSEYNFPNIIHPDCYGDFNNISLGQGNIITAGCNFTTDIRIGSFNIFNLNSTLGHDSVIEDNNVVNPGVNISGGVSIGSTNLIGAGATILQYLKIGSNSVLGAGAVLTKDLESNKLAIGIPAKVIKEI